MKLKIYNVKKFNMNITGLDVISVLNMNFIFKDCKKFNQLLDWNTIKVKELFGTFEGTKAMLYQKFYWNTPNLKNIKDNNNINQILRGEIPINFNETKLLIYQKVEDDSILLK